MKKSATSTFAALLAAAVYMHGSCLASENNANGGTGNILGALAGSAVPTAELGRQHARGTTNINVDTTVNSDGSFNLGNVRGNAVGVNSATGTITTTGSINNNTGFTTVFQNSGNNSLFQQSTSVYITLSR
jgi:hypothetical protein